MSAQQQASFACAPGSAGYSPVPSYADYSTSRCAPIQTMGTGVVPNPANYPLGFGVPQPVPPQAQARAPISMSNSSPSIPQAAPVAADVAAAKAAFVKQQQGQLADFVAYQQQHQQIGFPIAGVTPTEAEMLDPTTAAACHGGKQRLGAQEMSALARPVRGKVTLHEAILERAKTRVYRFDLDFTLAGAALNPTSVSQKIAEDAHSIFQLRDALSGEKTGEISNGILVNVDLLYAKSDCRIPLGVKVTGVKGNGYHANGGRYPIMVGYEEERDYGAKGRTIHRLTEHINMRRIERFGHLTMDKIGATIRPCTIEADVSFVEIDSPIVELIKMNQEYLQIDINSFSVVRGKHLLVDNALIDECKALLKREFFDATPFVDLRCFGIALERLDGQQWDSPVGIESFNSKNDMLVKGFLTKQNHVTVELRISYLLHTHRRQEKNDLPMAAAAASPLTNGY